MYMTDGISWGMRVLEDGLGSCVARGVFWILRSGGGLGILYIHAPNILRWGKIILDEASRLV